MSKSSKKVNLSKKLFTKSVFGLFVMAACSSALNVNAAPQIAVTDKEVTIGILHSSSGTMAISETGAKKIN